MEDFPDCHYGIRPVRTTYFGQSCFPQVLHFANNVWYIAISEW